MKLKWLKQSALLITFLTLGCTTNSAEKNSKFDSMKTNEKMTLDKSQLNMKKVKVAKPDGTLQCSQGKKIEIDVMQKDLKDITVFSSSNMSDGRMRIQMCGAPTGHYNVYEILEGDLEKAKALGFELWGK